MKSPSEIEPILGQDFREGFICPKCGLQGPRMRTERRTEGFALVVECTGCGYATAYYIGQRDE